ncbi:NAD-P-binding protein [Trametes coccinea BRFM310]|uniref:NAD-P-binding protein n=1 Tax=Trametes coccinea (strain BRFM310) TaxID=1353009 RepID=A0A1Y2IYW0_TRAC3|nr:NAD-P-binding protein [Trametes coccinea BRFM310]
MTSKQLVLITGINGFLGAHVVDYAVKAGYRVRGTVRSAKVEFARQNTAIYGSDVEVIAVDDLAYGNFTEALKGVDIVYHAAAPLPGRATPEVALRDAIEGALNLLRQTEEAGIKRFVLQSSAATVRPISEYANPWTEDDWLPTSKEQALKSTDDFFVYASEKTLAEQAVWEFAEKHPNIDVTTINPPFFIGPFAPSFRFTDALISQMSTDVLLYLLLTPTGQPISPVMLTIDVRDVARAAVSSFSSPLASEVGRKRLLFLPHAVGWKEVAEFIGEARPELRGHLSKVALSGELPPTPPKSPVDNSRSIKLLKLGELSDWKTAVLAGVDAVVEVEKNFAKEGKTFH